MHKKKKDNRKMDEIQADCSQKRKYKWPITMKRCSNSIVIIRMPRKIINTIFFLNGVRLPNINKDVHENIAF